MKRLLIVVVAAFALAIGWSATASAGPPVHQRSVACGGGTSFRNEFVEPAKAQGGSNSLKIVPGSGTGAAAQATAFSSHEFIVTDPSGAVVFHVGDADSKVGQKHQLFTCSTSAPEPGFTFYFVGFFLPAS